MKRTHSISAALLAVALIASCSQLEGGDTFYDCIKGNCKMPLKSGVFLNSDLAFYGSGSPPSGNASVITGVQFNGTAGSGGSGKLTVTSTQELSEVYLQIPGQSGYYVRQVSSADLVYSGNGSYVYSIDLQFGQGSSVGQQVTVGGKTTGQTVSQGISGVTLGGDNCTCGAFQNSDLIFVNGSGTPPGSPSAVQNPQFSGGGTAGSSGTLTFTSTQELSEVYLQIPGQSGYYVRRLTLADCVPNEGGGYTYTINLKYAPGYGGQQPTVSGTYATTGGSNDGEGTFIDERDGREYKYVIIGTQTWMAENLNYDVPGVTTDVCHSNNTANCDKYGRLYNWNTALTACPSGWHLPSDAEWTALTNFVGTNPGTKLKATSGWNAHATYGNGTDDYGFSALPGGSGNSDNRVNFGDRGAWWSSTQTVSINPNAYGRYMGYNDGNVNWINTSQPSLYSVRCVKDSGGSHFNPDITYGSLTDSRDSKTYRTVQIGSQTWMAENLNYDVPGVTTDVCYNNNTANCATYGRLYDWVTAMNGSASSTANPSGVQGVCPSGWHIPSYAEWDILVKYVDPAWTSNNYDGNIAGTKLKATSGWNTGSGYIAGTDDYGFSALPGGYSVGTSFGQAGDYGSWRITNEDSYLALGWNMGHRYESAYWGDSDKAYSYSVRCVKD